MTFDRVPREVVRWVLRKLGVDEWFIRTVMSFYTFCSLEWYKIIIIIYGICIALYNALLSSAL